MYSCCSETLKGADKKVYLYALYTNNISDTLISFININWILTNYNILLTISVTKTNLTETSQRETKYTSVCALSIALTLIFRWDDNST